ncbi:hypothetical protein QTJ16_003866 [Diplocarpon rosae]|uniref:Uncharacterized protein n=1 Tax=Diplocarpon rosae TaxID=946125 RepID=A0AAD9SZL9_9HELO|nr:hypothetical protein QTJ16_003866 [Diplocarpon rosae]
MLGGKFPRHRTTTTQADPPPSSIAICPQTSIPSSRQARTRLSTHQVDDPGLGMGSDRAKPAYCEDVDATSGRTVRGSRKTAAVKPRVSYQEEPVRERRKSGKPRKSPGDALATIAPAEPPTSAAQHVEIQRDMKVERRKSASTNTTHSPRKIKRPPSVHENRSFPGLDLPSTAKDTRQVEILTPTTTRSPAAVSQPIPFRPRAISTQTYPRPLSYQVQTPTGLHGPPLSMSAYYQQQPVTPSFPPPSSSASYMQYAAPRDGPYPQAQYTPQAQFQYAPAQPYASPQQQYTTSAQAQYPMGQGDSYFTPKASSRPLSARFDPVPRSSTAFEPATQKSSACGGRDIRSRVPSDYESAYHDDGYASAADGAARRKPERRNSIRMPSSAASMSRAEADLLAMPPPSRPAGILRKATEYTHDPKPDPGVGGYYEREERSEYREERPRRPSVSRHPASYDVGSVRVEAANSSRRRESQYDLPSATGSSSGYDGKSYEAKSTFDTKISPAQSHQDASSAYDAKLNQAQAYQEDVSGGPTLPLTAEVLRRQQRKQEGSSRSTKSSSASRDESDYKKSATTRTTRSSSGDNEESVTIKLVGQARVTVGGTQIDCTEGGEIQIQRQKNLRNGSERSLSEYGPRRIEDRQSRVSRPAGRSRMSSSRESSTRTPEYSRPRERGRDDDYF